MFIVYFSLFFILSLSMIPIILMLAGIEKVVISLNEAELKAYKNIRSC